MSFSQSITHYDTIRADKDLKLIHLHHQQIYNAITLDSEARLIYLQLKIKNTHNEKIYVYSKHKQKIQSELEIEIDIEIL